jgi:DNA phosphorothioation-associated putative methyltransferase
MINNGIQNQQIMNFILYKEQISALSFGKRLNNALYLHLGRLLSENNKLSVFVEDLRERAEVSPEYNVIKFILSEFRISFLEYSDFFKEPHPQLKSSITINLATGKIRNYNYLKSDNPPILHRKETLLEPSHPLITKFKAEAEECEGLYENPRIIGFKKNWEHLLNEKGLSYKGHKLIKIAAPLKKSKKSLKEIERHKTAITRYNFSQPIKTIFEYDLVNGDTTIFDYGCGQGDDLKGLIENGNNATGWDPVYFPNEPKVSSDVVNLGFVLNVIEDQIERTEVLQDAYALAQELLVVSGIVATSSTATIGRPYKDGIITSRNTFQKYFHQDELRRYIEDVLDTTAVSVGPGIFYVFRNPVDQQEFLSNRSKRTINWVELSRKLYPSRPKLRIRKRELLYEENKELIDRFWKLMLELGRLPKNNESDEMNELRTKFGTPNAARKLFIEKFGEETINEAFEFRRSDLLVYLALSNFKKKVPFKHLSTRLQNDIKTFLGSYKLGLEESRAMLFAIGNPDVITELCNKAEFGFFDHKALYIHKSLMKDLHPILRIYIGCAGILYGDLQNVDIIKLHNKSGKVTLLKYDNFENKPLPELQERVKINLRKQHIDFFDYQSPTYQQLLYFKENYVSKEYPSRSKWEKFSEKLRKIGFKDNIVIGPTKQEFYEFINKKGLTINLNKKRKRAK